MIHYNQCPSCGSNAISALMTVKDFSVSTETFQLMACSKCSLVFTQDIPAASKIGRYYQAEQYISHSDTRRGIINKLYHLIRARTIRQKRRLIQNYTGLKSGTILDIGSGTGSFLNAMRFAGWDISGIEPDDTARKNSGKLHGITAVAPDEAGRFEDHSFDTITMWHVLEHVHHLKEQVQQIGRLIKADGVVFIAVPNHSSFDARYYRTFWAAWDVPRHLYHFTPESMRFLWEQGGFEVVDIRPMWYDSFYVSMLSEKYRSGHTKIIHPVYIGMVSNIKALFSIAKCSSLIYVIRKKAKP